MGSIVVSRPLLEVDLDEQFESYAQVAFEVFGLRTGAGTLREQDEQARAGGERRRRFLLVEAGRCIGVASFASSPFLPADAVNLRVGVLATHRRKGHGGHLLAALEREARAAGALQAIVHIPQNDGAAMHLARRAGYLLLHERITLQVALDELDLRTHSFPPGFSVASPSVETAMPERKALAQALVDLVALSPDVRDLPPWELAAAERYLFAHPTRRADWTLVASTPGGDIAGMSLYSQIGDRAYSFFTGVREAFRGRGLARALKRKAMRAAASAGFTRMFADNLSTNARMLAVNESLGFARIETLSVRCKQLAE